MKVNPIGSAVVMCCTSCAVLGLFMAFQSGLMNPGFTIGGLVWFFFGAFNLFSVVGIYRQSRV